MDFQILVNLSILERLKLKKEIIRLIGEKPLRKFYFSSSKYRCYIEISKSSINIYSSNLNKELILELIKILNKVLNSKHICINLEKSDQTSKFKIQEIFNSNYKDISYI